MTQSGESFDPYYHWLGIPPDEQPPHHYRLLGIKLFEANRSVIQNAADRQMAHLRTFQTGPHGRASQKLLNEVAAARICLLSAEKKAAYDAQLNVPGAGAAPPAEPPAVSTDTVLGEANAQGGRVAAPVLRTAGSVPASRQLSKRRGARSAGRLLRFGLLLTAIAATGAVLLFFQRPAPAPNRLVLNWPAAERTGATLEIDGQQIDLSQAARTTAESVELELEPGPHEYRISHPRSDPLEGRFRLPRDGRVELDVVLRLAPTTARKVALVLVWPEQERDNHALEIDGRRYELTEDEVQVMGDEVRVLLPPGPHTVALIHDGKRRLERVVDVGSERRIWLSRSSGLGTLTLQWSPHNRIGFTLLLDEEVLDPNDVSSTPDTRTLDYTVSSGTRTLELRQGNSRLFTQKIEIVPQQSWSRNLDELIDRVRCRIAIQWPSDQREGAQLEVDGERHDVPAEPGADRGEVVIDVEPGAHTVRVTRPDHEAFEREITVDRGTRPVEVHLEPIVSMTIDERRYETLRDDYRAEYTQYDEYRDWNQQTDAANKKQALTDLLRRMSTEAKAMDPGSENQYIAYEAAYRLAVKQMELVEADSILDTLRMSRYISEQQHRKRKRALRDLAVSEADLEMTRAFFSRADTGGQTLSREQMRILGERISQAMRPDEPYESWERTVGFFQEQGLLTSVLATETRARLLLMKGRRVSQLDPLALFDLVKKMMELVPELVEYGTEEALSTSCDLLDNAKKCQRVMSRNPRVVGSLGKRLREIDDLIQQRDELITQYRYVVKARKSIAAGRGTATEHRLVGLWLLQKSEYEKAREHLRQSDDSPLVAIATSVPETERQRSDLVADIESEAKKTKYPARQKAAFKAYATYIQQLD